MATTKTVYLLVGPRGSGKSEYAEILQKQDPSMFIISRDKILLEITGSVEQDPYGGGFYIAERKLGDLFREKMVDDAIRKIILDCWSGNREQREEWISFLRRLGATEVIALYFVTPVELVENWFWKKPGVAKSTAKCQENKAYYSIDTPRRDYKFFHQLAKTIDDEGFDQVIRINPTQLEMFIE